MVQVLVEVRSGRWQERRQFEMLECTPDTGIADLKQRALAAAVSNLGKDPAPITRPIDAAAPHDLEFLGETCKDEKQLRDYGVCHDWIVQVAGFVLKPRRL